MSWFRKAQPRSVNASWPRVENGMVVWDLRAAVRVLTMTPEQCADVAHALLAASREADRIRSGGGSGEK